MRTFENERALLEQSLAGDMASWGKIIVRYKRAVFGVALHILGKPADAEDAMQDAFIRAYQYLHTFQVERKFSTWLLTITANICKNKLRREKFFSPLRHISKIAGGEDPARTAARDERHQLLRDALQQLDDGYRLPLVLRYYQDMDYKEIAEVLELPAGTVKTRLHRGKLELKKILTSTAARSKPTGFGELRELSQSYSGLGDGAFRGTLGLIAFKASSRTD
ncbi:sigma-70 family RNA polymerase sigma factor [Candidatus Acetothermia bacterium]|nr:sigma-70 family RNA polymerase sigma factor [Candidatus Acetothermia bacterium]